MLQRATVRPSTSFYRRFSLPMVRSPGFGSIYCYYFALFSLAFTTPPSTDLSLQQQITRWIVLQKARRHNINIAPSPCTHIISGSISLPFRGSFNLSLTVLVHYRSLDIFSLRRWTSQIQSGFHVSRPTQQTNDKVCDTWHTRLSLSMAELSRSFCSQRNFLTLCRLVVASAFQYEALDTSRSSYWLFVCYNPYQIFVYQLICRALTRNQRSKS